ncbi:hypothetical protein ABT075_11415 [Streptomyces sp. NPDC002677]|uniref:hypothetical protein n=1 Tax=Streptomyces sp. NPDC002677 TaxID=3154774 RepID=UPI0033313751
MFIDGEFLPAHAALPEPDLPAARRAPGAADGDGTPDREVRIEDRGIRRTMTGRAAQDGADGG